ncbi:MAG: hypothetical protein HUU35_13240, partial [Armatimonadetes bacterium]|nr:hypothetical protein [Armatimonadota bacterium]
MKQARRTCACVYACALGLSLVLPGRAAERQVSATLTPSQGLDLSRAQFAAAADADVVLEDRWLSARRGAQLAIVPEEA